MEAKKQLKFEHVVEENKASFTVNDGASLGFCYLACIEFLNEIVSQINVHSKKYNDAKPVEVEEDGENKVSE